MMNDKMVTSSKGNQNKWYQSGMWYKADGLGYEALAEVLVSRLLKKTSVQKPVRYFYVPIEMKFGIENGCKSADFLEPGDDKLISVERLFQTFRGESAAYAVLNYQETIDRIRFIEQSVREITGLTTFGRYLREALTIDALFLNEDRHFHNLAVIRRKDGSYRECPIFDNGASLFSDMRGDYPLTLSAEQCFEKIEAKPFARNFDDQLDACELAFPKEKVMCYFTIEDVVKILEEFQGIYDAAVLKRIEAVMRMQIRKYAYLFERS